MTNANFGLGPRVLGLGLFLVVCDHSQNQIKLKAYIRISIILNLSVKDKYKNVMHD